MRRVFSVGAVTLVGIMLAVVAACDSEGTETPPDEDPVPAACVNIAIDRFKSLAIVDEAVVTDPRSKNQTSGPWSFRRLVEELSPPGMAPEVLVRNWLDTWRSTLTVNTFKVDARPDVFPKVICPWLKLSPENKCDVACRSCEGNTLDLAKAPFRLIGMANRMDLRETEALGTAGEARFVFALTNGVGDDEASRPMLGTVIFEYKLPMTSHADVEMWATRFQALSSHAAFDEAYRVELQALTDSYSKRGASNEGVGGSAINQVRVNEREFDWQWDLREYKLAPTGLAIAPVFRSPDASVYESLELARWVEDNEPAILKRQHVTPATFTGGQSQPLHPIRLPSIDPKVRSIFAQETCAGCHQLEAPVIDVNFHYSPLQKGIAKLSPFLNSPTDPSKDELAHRIRSLKRALCGQ